MYKPNKKKIFIWANIIYLKILVLSWTQLARSTFQFEPKSLFKRKGSAQNQRLSESADRFMVGLQRCGLHTSESCSFTALKNAVVLGPDPAITIVEYPKIKALCARMPWPSERLTFKRKTSLVSYLRSKP